MSLLPSRPAARHLRRHDDDRSTLRTALSRLLGSLDRLAVANLAVQALFGEGGFLPWTDGPAGVDSTPTDGAASDDEGDDGTPEPDEGTAEDGDGNGDGDGAELTPTTPPLTGRAAETRTLRMT